MILSKKDMLPCIFADQTFRVGTDSNWLPIVKRKEAKDKQINIFTVGQDILKTTLTLIVQLIAIIVL